MTAPCPSLITFEILTTRAMQEDRRPVDLVYLAHVLIDESILDRYTLPRRLSKPARELLEVLDHSAAMCRLMSLAWMAADLEHVSDDAVAMATRVDALTAAEIANVGPFSHVASVLGIKERTKARPNAKGQAWERHARNAGVTL